MQISFFHRIPLQVRILAEVVPGTLAVGISGPVDPKTGMVLNLVEIQVWLKDFSRQAQTPSTSAQEFLNSAHLFLQHKLQSRSLRICRLELGLERISHCYEGAKYWSLESHIDTKSGEILQVDSRSPQAPTRWRFDRLRASLA